MLSFFAFQMRFPRLRPTSLTLFPLVLAGLMLPAAACGQVTFAGAQTIVAYLGGEGMAIDSSGNLYIADASAVYKLAPTPAGYTQTTVASGLEYAVGVAVDSSGNVYVTDSEGDSVFKETPSGGGYAQSVVVNSSNGLLGPVGVAVDGSGHLFVLDEGANELYQAVKSGSSYNLVPVDTSSLSDPTSLAADASDNLYIADGNHNRVLKETSKGGGSYTESVVADSSNGVAYPLAVAVDTSGNVYFSEQSGAAFKSTLSGNTFSTAKLPFIGLDAYEGIAVDSGGDVFATDLLHGQDVELSVANFDFGLQAVGSVSNEATFNFAFNAESGPVYGEGLIQGIAALDFGDTGNGTCDTNPVPHTYEPGDTCTVTVEFLPQAAGLRSGGVQVRNIFATPLVTVPVYGIGTSPQVVFGPSATTTSSSGYVYPAAVAVDAAGNVFVADAEGGVVDKVTPGGTRTLVGGVFSEPSGVAVDGEGNVYVTDGQNVYKVTPAGAKTTVGSGFHSPICLAADGAGNLYVGDASSGNVARITPAGAQTMVGSGFSSPVGIAVDAAGNVYVADQLLNNVYKVTPAGAQTTGGTGYTLVGGVAVDAAGDVYVLDSGKAAIDEVTPGGALTTLSTAFSAPSGIAIDSLGNLYVADSNSQRIAEVVRSSAPSLSFPTATNVGTNDTTDGTKTAQVFNIGNEALTFTSLGYPADFSAASGDANACTTSTGINPAGECDVPVEFTPRNAGSPLSENVTLTDNALTGPGTQQSIPVSGTGTGLTAQTISFAAITGTHAVGGNVTLSATATSGLPVSFVSTTPSVCTVAGTTASLITAGSCDIEAQQWGNGTYAVAPFQFQIFWINHNSQTINFGAIAAQTVLNTLPLSATATSGLAVSFASLTPDTCAVSGTTASLNAYGFCTIQASQAGNSIYGEAPHAEQTFFIHHTTQTISFPAPAFSQNADTTLPLTATATSGLTVTFASLTPATCTVSGATASLNNYGFCTIETSQSGNSVYGEAAHVDQTFFIHHIAQTITFGAIPSQTVGTPLSLSATASSGLTVGFSSLTPSVCTVLGTSATFITPGTCTIEATQPGNGVYGVAPAVKQSFKVTAP